MMGLTDFNLTPKAKKGLKDSQKFAEANGVILEDNPLQDDIDKANAEFESINESI